MLRTHKTVRICIAECLAFLGLVSVAWSVGFPQRERERECRVLIQLSLLSHMLENDLGYIHKLDMRSIIHIKVFHPRVTAQTAPWKTA